MTPEERALQAWAGVNQDEPFNVLDLMAQAIRAAVEEEREECWRLANAEVQSNAISSHRAHVAGRETVSLCRESDAETALRICERIRARGKA